MDYTRTPYVQENDSISPRPEAARTTKNRPPSLDLTVSRCRCSGCGCVSSREAGQESKDIEADTDHASVWSYNSDESIVGQEGDETVSETLTRSKLERSCHGNLPLDRWMQDNQDPFNALLPLDNSEGYFPGSPNSLEAQLGESQNMTLSNGSLLQYAPSPAHPSMWENMGAWSGDCGGMGGGIAPASTQPRGETLPQCEARERI